jgi:group I intron endonuclease
MFHIIYKTTNLVNGKYYYGVHSTKDINDDYLGSGSKLKNAIKKYGKENFSKEIIAVFSERKDALLKEKEIVNISLVISEECYNLTEGGGSPPIQETVPKSNLLKGEERTERQKIAAARHSDKMKNKTPWNKGVIGAQLAWNKGLKNPRLSRIANVIHICPKCGKEGKGSSMLRWHFDNCRNGM